MARDQILLSFTTDLDTPLKESMAGKFFLVGRGGGGIRRAGIVIQV